jgi:imidazolonepropionase-like amidohydrolase
MLLAASLLLVSGFSESSSWDERGADALVLRNATLLDGIQSQPLRRATIVIRSGRIAAIGGPALQVPGRTIDLEGRWLMPGLIDAHVHLNDAESARRALLSGVTTVRSLGGDAFVDIKLRMLHRNGQADVPEVLASGYQLTRQPSQALLSSHSDIRALVDGSRFADAMEAIARLNAAKRVDVIKVLATKRAGLPQVEPTERNLSDLELKSAIAEARRHGLPVVAHAHTDDGARAAVLLGASTIEHGTALSASTLQSMKSRRVCLVPTVSGWSVHWDGIRDNPVLTARARAMAPLAADTANRAILMGVRLVVGSDTTYGAGQKLAVTDEIAALVGAGMRPIDAFKSATSTAADCMGLSHRTGRVKQGLEADLLVVDTDPRHNLATLRNPRLIINDGVVALNGLR